METISRKFFESKILSIDEENHTLRVAISDDRLDRDDEIVDQDTLNLDEWEQNPVVITDHNPFDVLKIVGEGKGYQKQPKLDKNGVQVLDKDGTPLTETVVEMKFDVEDKAHAEAVFGKIKRGVLRTVSIGIGSAEKVGKRLMNTVVSEISWVTVPSNIGATVKSLNDGMLKVEDAEWLQKQAKQTEIAMTKFISENRGEKMTDEEITKLTTGIVSGLKEGFAEALKVTNEKLDALVTAQKDPAKDTSETNGASSNDPGTKDETITPEGEKEIMSRLDAIFEDDNDDDDKGDPEDGSST